MIDRHPDIAVIGGGVIGLFAARELLAAGARVRVIDAGPAAPAASLAAAGMLAPSFEAALGDGAAALYRLGAESLAQWREEAPALEAETGIDLDYRADGIVAAARTPHGVDALARQAARLREAGARSLILDGVSARAMEPALSPEIECALFAPDDAHLDPRRLLPALRDSVRRRGGQAMDDIVSRAVSDGEGWRLTLKGGETLSSAFILLAAGAGASGLIAGLPAPPVFPVKGEALSLAAAPPRGPRRVVRGERAYLCPKAKGRLVVGASEKPNARGEEVDPETIRTLRVAAEDTAPALEGAAETARWAGLRPATPDGAPILGRDPRGPGGVFLALGHHRNGVLLAPASARVLVKEILEGGAIDPAFRAERFEESGAADD